MPEPPFLLRTVYVDAAIHPWQGHRWCHLFCCDLADLHRFAASLGLQRRRFQQPPRASWPHYDITAEQRLHALGLGAEPADRWQLVLVRDHVLLGWCRQHSPGLVGEKLAVQQANLQRYAARPVRRGEPAAG